MHKLQIAGLTFITVFSFARQLDFIHKYERGDYKKALQRVQTNEVARAANQRALDKLYKCTLRADRCKTPYSWNLNR